MYLPIVSYRIPEFSL